MKDDFIDKILQYYDKPVSFALTWIEETKALHPEEVKWLRQFASDAQAFRAEAKFLLSEHQWAALKSHYSEYKANAKYQKELSRAREENAGHSRKIDKLEGELASALTELRIAELRLMIGKESIKEKGIPADMAKVIRMLVHPDKHNNSAAATKAFTFIQSVCK